VLQGPARDAVRGRHVVLVEDIVDTGLSTAAAVRHLRRKAPASLRLCVLLDRPDRRRTPVRPDYLGFTVPGRFLVGYGLDVDQRYRHLPEVYALEEP
jgi:hypoxanthine phosphoribosyltransferase